MATESFTFIGFVYKYTNKKNGKVYIGETVDLKGRQKAHQSQKGFSYFHKAIEEEGIEMFDLEIIYQCEGIDKNEVKNKIIELEEFYINEYQAFTREKGYNYCCGANYGSNGIYWELTIFDNKIYNAAEYVAYYQKHEDFGKVKFFQERITILKQEREALRIILGASY